MMHHRVLLTGMVVALTAAPMLPAMEAMASMVPLVTAISSVSAGLIRPELQPGDLFERHSAVVQLRITAVDAEAHRVTLTVVSVSKGTFAPATVTMRLAGDQVLEAFFKLMAVDQVVVAYIGSPRKPFDVLFYAGGEGRWQVGHLDADAAAWEWTGDLGQGGEHSLFGTFNGSAALLAEMMADRAAGRMYFPATPIDHFTEERVLATCAQPIRGVALHDLDGDGRLDVYACSKAGDRMLLQQADGTFTERTAELGLAGVASSTVQIADVDGDGRQDLVLDGVIWRQGADGRFTRTTWMDGAAGRPLVSVLAIDEDRDGYPDLLLSYRDGGLHLWRNPGAGGGSFIDRTAASGLDQAACGAGGTGWVMAGDWRGDGGTSLFYATAGGLLLTRDGTGRFAPQGTAMGYDFTAGGTASGLTGAGCFAPLWHNGRQDLVVTQDTRLAMAVNAGNGVPDDGIQYGNELQLATLAQLPVIAEDLNADGTVDLYVGSRGDQSNIYYANRGYGSFLVPDRYDATVFPGTAHRHGAWGLAAGDVDGDGANDLLIGGPDGRVSLLLNDCLAHRRLSEHPTAVERTLDGVRILAVQVRGPLGVVGATVTITAVDGRVLGRRDLGSNVATGCSGPDTVTLAVREPGAHVLTVRWSDGITREWHVAMGPEAARTQHLIAERTGGTAH